MIYSLVNIDIHSLGIVISDLDHLKSILSLYTNSDPLETLSSSLIQISKKSTNVSHPPKIMLKTY